MFLDSLVQGSLGTAYVFRLTLGTFHAVDAVLLLALWGVYGTIRYGALIIGSLAVEEGA